MIYGCLTASQIGQLPTIKGKMNFQVDQCALEDDVGVAVQLKLSEIWMMQYDHDPKH